MDYYFVKKLVSGIVTYNAPGKMVARVWKGPDARQRIPFDELEECVYDPAIRTLFDRGYLIIEDKDIRVKLGMEEEDSEVNNNNQLILTRDQIKHTLYEDSMAAFQKKCDQLAPGSKELLIEIALNDEKQASVDKYDYIRKNYFVDVEGLRKQMRDEKQGG